MSTPDSVYRIGLAVAIVSAAEEILIQQFRWQHDNSHLCDDMSKVPLVVMANMQKSPAAMAINLLARGLLHDDSQDESCRKFVASFLRLHTGAVNRQVL